MPQRAWGGGSLGADSWLGAWLAAQSSRWPLFSDLCGELTRHRGHWDIQKELVFLFDNKGTISLRRQMPICHPRYPVPCSYC